MLVVKTPLPCPSRASPGRVNASNPATTVSRPMGRGLPEAALAQALAVQREKCLLIRLDVSHDMQPDRIYLLFLYH